MDGEGGSKVGMGVVIYPGLARATSLERGIAAATRPLRQQTPPRSSLPHQIATTQSHSGAGHISPISLSRSKRANCAPQRAVSYGSRDLAWTCDGSQPH